MFEGSRYLFQGPSFWVALNSLVFGSVYPYPMATFIQVTCERTSHAITESSWHGQFHGRSGGFWEGCGRWGFDPDNQKMTYY